MERLPTRLDGLVLLAPTVHGDERGFFLETYREDAWARHGVPTAFVQDNHSRSRRGTLRGIHFQTSPGQGKLVRAVRGAIFDVAVDLRRGSPTFLHWHGEELSAGNHKSMLIPAGFAHGLQTLENDCELLYFHSAPYAAEAEGGIHPQEPKIGIAWLLPIAGMSTRDRGHPALAAEFKGLAL